MTHPGQTGAVQSEVPAAKRRSWIAAALHYAPSLAIFGTAFFYEAGYTYLDQLYRAFGVSYAASSPSTAEVVGWGYLVTLFAAIQGLKRYTVMFVGELAVASFLVFPVVVWARRDRRLGIGLSGWLDRHHGRVEALADRTLIGIACFFVLLGAGPAGDAAARHDIAAVKSAVQRGCCFTYSDGRAKVTGRLLAMTQDRVFLVTRDGVASLGTENLTITAARAPRRGGQRSLD